MQLTNNEEFMSYLEHWRIYPRHRVSVYLHNANQPITNSIIELIGPSNNTSSQAMPVIWTARTDNKGRAELWASLFENSKHVDFKDYRIKVNGQLVDNTVTPYFEQVIDIEAKTFKPVASKTEIAFIVDATGSLQDEIDFLKRDLQSVIQAVEQDNDEIDIKTSAVFYRDKSSNGEQELYLVRNSEFGNLNGTMRFIKEQEADGGGDFPEAVDVALDTAINKLKWSDNAHARIAFLILDAPPHNDDEVIASVQKSIVSAAAKGIKIIPISASGIDKETKFFLRSVAMTTNGTYSFITDDSGVGNSHLEASVGKYDVEKLNALMIRLIKENTDFYTALN